MAQVQFQHIHKSYGPTRVLEDINIDVKDGEFLVLVGPSGCGKSTLLSALVNGPEALEEKKVAKEIPIKKKGVITGYK